MEPFTCSVRLLSSVQSSLYLHIRVTRWVCEKVAQAVAQPVNSSKLMHRWCRGEGGPKNLATSVIFKTLLEENNYPIWENWPNLVTLLHIFLLQTFVRLRRINLTLFFSCVYELTTRDCWSLLTLRVTRCVREKVTQNVSQLVFLAKSAEKEAQNMVYLLLSFFNNSLK
jgi:hypothetical protein